MYAIKFNFLRTGAKLPVYTSAGSSIFALNACLIDQQEVVSLAPGASAVIGTGLAVAIPAQWTLVISAATGGLGAGQGLLVQSHFRDEIAVPIVNTTSELLEIRHGDVIALGGMTRSDGRLAEPAVHWAFQVVPKLPAPENKQSEVEA